MKLKNKNAKEKNDIKISSREDFTEIKDQKKVNFPSKKFLLLVILLVLLSGFLGYSFRGKFLAAVVNGKPIFRSQFNKKMETSFGKQVLENMIIEELIKQEADKNNILVTQEEIDKEKEKISASLSNNIKLEDALAMQGMTMEDFLHQVKLRLEINKILGKDLAVSDEEISNYVKNNKSSLTATSEAEQKEEARQILQNQKSQEKIQAWIDDLLKKAKITRFLQ